MTTCYYCLNQVMTTSNRPGHSREVLFLSFRISKETAFIFATEHLASEFVLRSKMGEEWITTNQVRLAIFSYFIKSYGLQIFSLRKWVIQNALIIIYQGFSNTLNDNHANLPCLLLNSYIEAV